MNEREWLTGKDPYSMFRWDLSSKVTGSVPFPPGYLSKISERKFRLFACAISRLLQPHPGREPVVKACEQIADGEKSRFGSGYKGLVSARESIQAVWGWIWSCTAKNPWVAVGDAFIQMRGNAGSFYRQEEVADLFRCLVSYPSKHRELCYHNSHVGGWENNWPNCSICSAILAWEHGKIPRLAQSIYKNRDFAGLPALHDALLEAGCPEEFPCISCSDPTNLWPKEICVNCKGTEKVPNPVLEHLKHPGPHAKGCWPIDLILGKK